METAKVVLVMIGALRTVSKNIIKIRLKEIRIECLVELLQKAGLLGTIKIIRQVPST